MNWMSATARLALGLCMATGLALKAQSSGGTPTGTFTLDINPATVDLTFKLEQVPGPGAGIYWAQQFWLTNGPGGYLGLQTDGNAWNQNVGKMAIFSIWDTSTGRPSSGTYGTTFGGEGEGYSLRRKYDWQQGRTYRFRLAHEGQGWWGVTLTDVTSAQSVYFGAIQVPNTNTLQRSFSNFTEYYLGHSCTNRPYARVRFLRPVGDQTHVAQLSNPHTYNVCPNTARSYASNGELIHEVGSCLATGTCNTDQNTWLSGSALRLMYADSQETSGENGRAANAVDGRSDTIWHTAWTTSPTPAHPHEIQVDLGSVRTVNGVGLLPRPSGTNGMIRDLQVYVSESTSNWGVPVHTGTLGSSKSEQVIPLSSKRGRYVRVVALSELAGNPWTSLAEIRVRIGN